MKTFYGPERPTTLRDLGLYTGETFTYRGHTLHRRNQWRELFQQWDSRETSITVVGPGADWNWRYAGGCRARVAGIEADAETMLEALDEAWRLAEAEGQLRHLAKGGA